MKLNNVDFETYFNNYPDKDGYFGKYGGVFIFPGNNFLEKWL